MMLPPTTKETDNKYEFLESGRVSEESCLKPLSSQLTWQKSHQFTSPGQEALGSGKEVQVAKSKYMHTQAITQSATSDFFLYIKYVKATAGSATCVRPATPASSQLRLLPMGDLVTHRIMTCSSLSRRLHSLSSLSPGPHPLPLP